MSSAIRAAITVCVLCFTRSSPAATYYVDFSAGNDGRDGTSQPSAWRSISKVNAAALNPGDSVCFKRGTTGTGQLTISRSGTQMSPITFTAYGTGADPVIRNPGASWVSAIKIAADWVIVEHFMAREAMEAGINIAGGADHNIVRDNEITLAGTGVSINGQHNLVTRNYAHDLTMIVNTPGGDDDFGAVGIWLYASSNEVSYNRMLNCRALSQDYGMDGGMVEFYGDVDSCYIHHNRGENCEGTFEAGGQGQTLSGNILAYNVAVNNGGAGGFHVGGNFGVYFQNFRVENNVFVEMNSTGAPVQFWNGTANAADFVYRNNIFYAPNAQQISNQSGFTHDHNLYYLGGKTTAGFALGTGDKIGDPLFVNVGGKDFHLKAGSPAINAGTMRPPAWI